MTGAAAIPRVRFGAVIVLVAAVAAGCAGGGDDRPTAAGAAANGVSAVGGQAMIDAQADFARCMRRQGIDMPAPRQRGFTEFDPGAAGVSEEQLREAESHCARQRRAIADAAPKLSDADRRAALEAGLRYARCMRSHGQDVPDPSAGDEGRGMAIELPADAEDNPAFQVAARSCDRLLREGER